MHDIDRAMFEIGHETGYETGHEVGHEVGHELFEFEASELGNEAAEFELATELLEISTEAELDRFLGKLISSAGSAVRSFAGSDAGRAVGGLLKTAAKRVLPQVGRILGDYVSPGVGGQVGRRAGQWLGNQFEFEGLSNEDRELETARAFVKFAQDTARQAARAAGTAPAAVCAQRAALASAQRHAPALTGLISAARPTRTVAASTSSFPATSTTSFGARSPLTPAAGARSGRWERQGNRVVLIGL